MNEKQEQQFRKLIKFVQQLVDEHNKLEARVGELEKRVKQLGAILPYEEEKI
jgi:hypothetical protein